MKHSAIVFTAPWPTKLAVPGFKGGPAPYASHVLTIFFVQGWSAHQIDRPANDNGGGEAA